jgi:hypothetical protein
MPESAPPKKPVVIVERPPKATDAGEVDADDLQELVKKGSVESPMPVDPDKLKETLLSKK